MKSMSEPKSVSPDFPFYVTFEEDGSWTFDWDQNHPVTSIFNDWTEKDFMDMLLNAAQEVIDAHEGVG